MAEDTFIKSQTDKLFASLDAGGYSLSQYSYPDNVGSTEVGHFIMFLINETAVGASSNSSIIRPITNPNIPDIFGQTIPRNEQSGANGIQSKRLLGMAGKTRRTKEVISLYMPENITSVYGLDYENTDMGVATAVGSGSIIDTAQNTMKGNFDKLNLSSTELYQSLAGANASLGSDAGRVALSNSNQAIADALSGKFREARNPHMEFLFRGIQLRTFTFEFTFTPKSAAEAVNVYNIIKLFKMNAIPEVRENNVGVFYKYPAEFDILFISNGAENRFLHRISTCALTNIAVRYSTAGQNSMHKSIQLPDGRGAAPTHTTIELQFTEMELMSKQRMEEGY